MVILKLIGRDNILFKGVNVLHYIELKNIISNSTFLVNGGAGSIGQAVTKEIFKK